MDWLQDILALLSGGAVGFSLGLIGGGGSILAVPLLLYVVGVSDAHLAIGTSALAVAVNALTSMVGHWRQGTVKWPCALVFTVSGIVGAVIGSSFGKVVDGQKLIFLFAVMMIVIGLSMLRPRTTVPNLDVRITPRIAAALVAVGLVVGVLSGFFGIGGGFLIVPGLMLGSGMPILNAIGSSLVAVSAFGFTTAINYALSGLIVWTVAFEFIAGGLVGGMLGRRLAMRLASQSHRLTHIFVATTFVVAAYMLVRSGIELLGI